MKKKSKPTKNEGKTKESGRKPKRRSRRGTNWKGIFMVAALVLAMIAFIFSSIPTNFNSMKPKTPSSNASNTGAPKNAGSEFKKEGSLQFLKADGSTQVTNIDIELADTEYQRAQGLMHRRYMADNHGMLFIMDAMETQSFFMRNTHISLDIKELLCMSSKSMRVIAINMGLFRGIK